MNEESRSCIAREVITSGGDQLMPLTVATYLGAGSRTAWRRTSLIPRSCAAAGQTQTAAGQGGLALVEDDERVREALAFQLATAGYQVVPFASGAALLA